MENVALIRMDRKWSGKFVPEEKYEQYWQVNSLIKCWEENFTTKYTDFRSKLHDIQKDNLSRIGFDKIIYLNDPSLHQILSSNGNYRIFPIDDDDWFHDDLLNLIYPDESRYIRWDYTLYMFDGIVHLEHPFTTFFHEYQSNNYAIMSPMSQEFIPHGGADKGVPRNEERYLNQQLSVHNRCLSSLSNHMTDRSFELQIIRNYNKFTSQNDEEILSQVPECFRKYLKQVQEMQRDLKINKKRITYL